MTTSGNNDQLDRLHYAALNALRGTEPAAASALADLLRSDFEIDRTIRDLLADALEGKAKNGWLNFPPVANDIASRKLATYYKNIRLGSVAINRQCAGASYEQACEAAATEFRVSIKQVQAAVTIVKKRELWISSRVMNSPTDSDGLHRFVWEWCYDEGEMTGIGPDQVHKKLRKSD